MTLYKKGDIVKSTVTGELFVVHYHSPGQLSLRPYEGKR